MAQIRVVSADKQIGTQKSQVMAPSTGKLPFAGASRIVQDPHIGPPTFSAQYGCERVDGKVHNGGSELPMLLNHQHSDARAVGMVVASEQFVAFFVGKLSGEFGKEAGVMQRTIQLDQQPRHASCN
jgi:hypothetical protein